MYVVSRTYAISIYIYPNPPASPIPGNCIASSTASIYMYLFRFFLLFDNICVLSHFFKCTPNEYLSTYFAIILHDIDAILSSSVRLARKYQS